jgi:Raf kinase inhibitor-like YbhB/YbcL family protein
MNISSAAFGHKQPIPKKYTCEGENANPPLAFSGQPQGTVSLALIVNDPDAPSGTYTHWLVYNMPASASSIGENSLPPGSLQGVSSAGHMRYDGPCPPSGNHRYVFKLYALNVALEIGAGASRQTVESAMRGHILGRAELIGMYQKANGQI